MSVEDQVRPRIAMLRFLMMFGVVFLHAQPALSRTVLTNALPALTGAALQPAVFFGVVPALAVVCGHLLARRACPRPGGLSAARRAPFTVFEHCARPVPAPSLPGVALRAAAPRYPRRMAFLHDPAPPGAARALIHWLYKSGAHDSFSNRNLFVGKC